MKLTKILLITLFFNTFAYADKNMKIGTKGKESEVSRTIKVVMYDNYYEPSSFQIKSGETIKFEVENAGMLVHEFNIANKMMHMKHQPEMMKMVENEILLVDSIDKEKMKKMAKMDKLWPIHIAIVFYLNQNKRVKSFGNLIMQLTLK